MISLLLAFGCLSCSTLSKSAVSCPDISPKKNDYRAYHKLRKTGKAIAYKGSSSNRSVHRLKSVKNKDINNYNPHSTNIVNRAPGVSMIELNKILVASADNRQRPAISNIQSQSLSETENKVTIYSQQDNCDTILLRSGGIILGKIEEIGVTELKYRKCNNLSGPLISILVTEVSGIHYINGTNEVFGPSDAGIQGQARTSDTNSTVLKNEVLGSAGFLIAVVGLFIASIPLGILATIFGIVSLTKINKSPKRLKGRGFAILAIIIGITEAILMIIALS